ncbi:adenosylcobinamide-phosphate synthase CbiB [Donghicola eburneus]|uniref:Cobalamin biosynthesis protein CobD n=1 Tax=Donghicola eburneus TaxID=393278 RepID=A0A1M4N4J7_9RHOB|nr:adenosylcobinamide-phosphate synthase CbiB [Donghicola eburneus]SCM69741.1 Cobalamin biosynthesis protein CobD [Donghicola eburneus]SFQ64174.1 adenosylcobinamide-phosphate synthase [Donghicola eburneus]
MSAALILAMALDAVMGEPKALWDRVPHPAVLMGRTIDWADKRFNKGEDKRQKGVIALGLLILFWIVIAGILSSFGWIVQIVCAAILLAQKSLVEHVEAVAAGLRQTITRGRKSVAMIVGRDTAEMEEPAVARAAIESAAENFSDGVIAPAFWFLIGGLPGIVLYKLVNTADSMIGHRTPRHEEFGWAAARLDDWLNWVPARLSAVLILLSHGRPDLWRGLPTEARQHRSPNAGWPESAMARVLNVSLSGPRAYHGQMQDFPWVHPSGNRYPGPMQIDAACTVLWRAWAGMVLLATLIWLI